MTPKERKTLHDGIDQIQESLFYGTKKNIFYHNAKKSLQTLVRSHYCEESLLLYVIVD